MTKFVMARKALFISTVVGALGMAFPDFRKDLFYIKDNAGLINYLPDSFSLSENGALICSMCLAFFGSLGLLLWHNGKS